VASTNSITDTSKLVSLLDSRCSSAQGSQSQVHSTYLNTTHGSDEAVFPRANATAVHGSDLDVVRDEARAELGPVGEFTILLNLTSQIVNRTMGAFGIFGGAKLVTRPPGVINDI
jgi:hypothetical protein